MERMIRRFLDNAAQQRKHKRLLSTLAHTYQSTTMVEAMREIGTPTELERINCDMDSQVLRMGRPDPDRRDDTADMHDIRRHLPGINATGWQRVVDIILVTSLTDYAQFSDEFLGSLYEQSTPWQTGLLTSLFYWYGVSWNRGQWFPEFVQRSYTHYAGQDPQAGSEYLATVAHFRVPFTHTDTAVHISGFYRSERDEESATSAAD